MMLEPNSAVWVAAKLDLYDDRHAQQVAAVRNARSEGTSRVRVTLHKLHSLLGRADASPNTPCDD